MTYDIREFVVVAGHGVAFCHGLHHVTGRLRTGQPVDMVTGKVPFALKP